MASSDEPLAAVGVSGGAQSPPSDNDGGERPVRRQLQETSIETAPAEDRNTNGRKRSFEESRDDSNDTNENGNHSRKRSRECTPEETKNTDSARRENESSGALPQNVSASDPEKVDQATPLDNAQKNLNSGSESTLPDPFATPEISDLEDYECLEGQEVEAAALAADSNDSEESDSETGNDPESSSLEEPHCSIDEEDDDTNTNSQEPFAHEPSDADQASNAAKGLAAQNDIKPSSIDHGSTPSTKESNAMNNEPANVPMKKRSREQLEDESLKISRTLNETAQEPAPREPSGEDSVAKGEPDKKRHRDNSEERDAKIDNGFAASAFGKAAAASPFASIGKPLTEEKAEKTTSSSVFASSSLSAFAGSETSPFSALGASKLSVFKPAGDSSSFTSAAGTSGFGALGGGFAGVGGGFGAAGKSAGLSSFASPNAPASFGDSKPKAIGADESDEEGSDDDGEETSTFEAEKTDERFYEQTIETGEENESTIFTCKAKLFHFSNKEWKERGIGTFKVNVRENANGKTTGRMIMRADGALRVMLNSPIFKGMNYGDAHNNAPSSKQILLASVEEGKTVPLLLRTGNEAYAKELYKVIGDLLEKA